MLFQDAEIEPNRICCFHELKVGIASKLQESPRCFEKEGVLNYS